MGLWSHSPGCFHRPEMGALEVFSVTSFETGPGLESGRQLKVVREFADWLPVFVHGRTRPDSRPENPPVEADLAAFSPTP